MGDLVDTRAVGPPIEIRSGSGGNIAQVVLDQGPYRKANPDLCCVRLIAASVIVAGLLLGTAPVALAQVGHLIATAPAAYVQEIPAHGTWGAGGVDADHSSKPIASIDRIVQHQSITHSVMSIFSWKGTSGALKCSYGLLFKGDTRTCQAA